MERHNYDTFGVCPLPQWIGLDGQFVRVNRALERLVSSGSETKRRWVRAYRRHEPQLMAGQRVRWSITIEQRSRHFDVLGARLSRTGEMLLTAIEVSSTVELQRSFDALTANVHGAVMRYVRRPDGPDEVEYLSPGCAELWEIPASEVQRNGAALWDAVWQEDLAGVQRSIADSAAYLTPWSHRFRIATRSGRRKWVQSAGQPERLPDGSVAWNAFVLDVTDQERARARHHELERQLLQAHRLEALGRLAGGIAHDFNNMLTVILGATETALHMLPRGADRQEVSEVLEDVQVAARRSADLTRRLLSISRQRPNPSARLAPAEHISQLGPILRSLLGAQREFVLNADATTPEVRMDPAALDQLVTNLVANARDATAPGGRVEVTVLPDGKQGARIIVSDDGSGISQEVLPHIFEPFFSTKADQGTGLGLATVYGIVQGVGGSIDVRSPPGGGARFDVVLPAASAERGTRPSDPGAYHEAMHVLVVDGEPQVRNLVVRYLKERGFAVWSAPEAQAAGARLRVMPRPPDLVLTDVVIPGVGQTTPVIYMSAVGADVSETQPGAGHLAKPFTFDQLDRAVSTMLWPS